MGRAVVKKETAATRAAAKKSLRSARLDIRMTAEQRELMVAAARARGMTVTTFLLAAGLERAESVIRDETVTSLSLRDWKKVQEMIHKPAPPNQALRDAMDEYQGAVSSDV